MKGLQGFSVILQLFCKPKTITKYKIKTKTQQYEGTYLVLLFKSGLHQVAFS